MITYGASLGQLDRVQQTRKRKRKKEQFLDEVERLYCSGSRLGSKHKDRAAVEGGSESTKSSTSVQSVRVRSIWGER